MEKNYPSLNPQENLLDDYLLFGFYYSLAEAVFNGKTLGKLVTQTRAVQEDGSPITTSMAFIRGFSRLIPFEAISALGSPPHPWHDKWSRTFVVNEEESKGLVEKAILSR
ncbi:RDD family protein [Flavitalea flava]